jgi:hypothetical protein
LIDFHNPETIMKFTVGTAAAGLAMLTLTACVAGSPDAAHAAAGGWVSLLFLGLWHGLIGPVTLIVEIVNHFAPHLLPWKAHIYDTGASGVPYDVGFYFGLAGSPVVLWSRRG